MNEFPLSEKLPFYQDQFPQRENRHVIITLLLTPGLLVLLTQLGHPLSSMLSSMMPSPLVSIIIIRVISSHVSFLKKFVDSVGVGQACMLHNIVLSWWSEEDDQDVWDELRAGEVWLFPWNMFDEWSTVNLFSALLASSWLLFWLMSFAPLAFSIHFCLPGPVAKHFWALLGHFGPFLGQFWNTGVFFSLFCSSPWAWPRHLHRPSENEFLGWKSAKICIFFTRSCKVPQNCSVW